MISFEELQIQDGSPMYAQMIRYIKHGMIAGTIRDGDELPSRRMLSALLGINPNTIQKAYRLMEAEQLIVSHTGAKSYVTLDEKKIADIRAKQVEEDATTFVTAMKQMGISKKEVSLLLEKVWNRKGER
ncbi:MAG: GntR family transcriptional regulator [Evtepia sp.]